MMKINTKANTITSESPAVKAFLKNAKQYPLLTEEEVIELVNKANKGDIQARNKVINSNLLFMFSVCNKFANKENVLDLVGEATEGMIMAIERFDTTRGIKFISFAVHYIGMKITKYYMDIYPSVKKTNNRVYCYKVNKIVNEFYQKEHREPSVEELKDILENEYEMVVQDISYLYNVRVNSIDTQLEDSDDTQETVGEFAVKNSSINEYEHEIEENDMQRKVNTLLSVLTPREELIIKMAYGLGEWKNDTQNDIQIGNKIGVCPERIRQLKAQAVLKMKNSQTKLRAIV